MVSDDEFADMPPWVAELFAEAVAETLRKKAEKARIREGLALRRDLGLQRRHAAKLERNRAQDSTERED